MITPASGTWIAREIVVELGVATGLVYSGSDWHFVNRPLVESDSGVSVDIGPHAWWLFVSQEDAAFIVRRWIDLGVVARGKREHQPVLPMAIHPD